MSNYHINQKTGNINICRAKPGNCPLKDEEGESAPHFNNKESAQSFLESELSKEHGSTARLEKKSSKNNAPEPKKLNLFHISGYINPIHADYDYSYEYHEDGGESIDPDSVFLNSIDVDQLARDITKDKNDLTNIQEILENNGASHPSNYSIEIYEGIGLNIDIEFENKRQTIKDLENYATGDRSMLKEKPQNIKAATYTPNIDFLNDISTVADVEYDYIDYYSNEIDESSVYVRKMNEEMFAKTMMKADRKYEFNNDEDKDNIEETKKMLRNIGAFDLDNYTASVESGYHENDLPEIFVIPKNIEKMKEDFHKEYYKKNNAKDTYGVLEYVRSKGEPTEGLIPLDAIKEQLRNENKGRTSSLVEKSTKVSSKKIRLDEIRIGAPHRYESVDAQETKSENGSDEVAGVVFYDKARKAYRLIDGYHRMKGLKNKNRKIGTYIVLS